MRTAPYPSDLAERASANRTAHSHKGKSQGLFMRMDRIALLVALALAAVVASQAYAKVEQLKCTFRGSGLVTLEFANILSRGVTKGTPIHYTFVRKGKRPDKNGTYVVSNDATPGAVIGWQGFSDDFPGKSCTATVAD
jgi:hypothetical protein